MAFAVEPEIFNPSSGPRRPVFRQDTPLPAAVEGFAEAYRSARSGVDGEASDKGPRTDRSDETAWAMSLVAPPSETAAADPAEKTEAGEATDPAKAEGAGDVLTSTEASIAPPATNTMTETAGITATDISETTADADRPELVGADETAADELVETAHAETRQTEGKAPDAIAPEIAAAATGTTVATGSAAIRIRPSTAGMEARIPSTRADTSELSADDAPGQDVQTTETVELSSRKGADLEQGADQGTFDDMLMAGSDKTSSGDKGTLLAHTFGTAQAMTPAGSAAAAPANAILMNPTLVAAHNVIVAAPEEIVDIVADTLSGNDGKDRITVQLDPPELGRVSIDFKFDGQMLQHVTISGENQEALRRLRLMHFELVNALEQNGLSSNDMTFREHGTGSGQAGSAWRLPDGSPENTDDAFALPAQAALKPARRLATAGLDIKL